MKKTVLRVSINCIKCKREVLKIVSKLEGVNAITVDGDKGTLTVIGDVDPVLLTRKLRKKGKTAEIISVGPPKKDPTVVIPKSLPSCCRRCEFVGFVLAPSQSPPCSIL